jgi:hypothetical protein
VQGEMLCTAGSVHGDTSRLHVGLYSYDGMRVERTGGTSGLVGVPDPMMWTV